MEIIKLKEKDDSEYQAFLDSCEASLLYYGLPYKRFLEALLGCRSEYWIARENGKITGVLPVMEKGGPFGRVLNSLPYYGSHGAVLHATQAARDALYARFDALANHSGVAAATLIGHPLLSSEEAPVEHNFQDERIGQFTRLPQGENLESRILALLDGSTRRNIRKAKDSGITVSVDNKAVEFLERIHCENMALIGGREKTRAFFDLFPKYFEADREYRIYVASQGNRAVSALLLFYFNRTVEYFVPVTVKEHRSIQPMAEILYRAMLDAARAGYTGWNWGGTWNSQEGVHRFKRKWGAQDHRYRYYVKVNDESLLEQTEDALLEGYPGFYVVPFSCLHSVCL